MFKDIKKDEVAVLFQISKLNKRGFGYFYLDNSEYSLFDYEKEILLNTDTLFECKGISE